MKMEPIHSRRRSGADLARSMTVVMAEGPAMRGMATGTMKGSPPESASTRLGPEPGKTMLMAIRKRITPPAMRRVSSERRRASRKNEPNSKKTTRVRKAMPHSRRMT
jgi:hypothetical protein